MVGSEGLTHSFMTVAEFREYTQSMMGGLGESLESFSLRCRIVPDEGALMVARRESPASSATGVRIICGADFGNILLWSGLRYSFPMSELSPAWIGELLNQPDNSFFRGVLNSLDESINSRLGIEASTAFYVSSDAIEKLLAGNTLINECRVFLRSQAVASSGIVAAESEYSMVIHADSLRLRLDLGLCVWEQSWVFSLSDSASDSDIPSFIQRFAVVSDATATGSV